MDVRQKNKKKVLIIVLVVILISSLGGFFLWWQTRETPPEEWEKAEYSKPEDYVVKETAEGKIVENKKAGLSFKIPERWRMEKPEYGDYVAFFSPEAEGTLIIEKGCKIMSEVRHVKTNFQAIEQILRKAHKEWGYIDEYEIIQVSGHSALKNTTGIVDLNQYGIGVHIPVEGIFKSKLYYLGLSSNLQDKEKCNQEFEKFLETVSIK